MTTAPPPGDADEANLRVGPPKDVAGVEKRAEKQTAVEERGYELRAVHEGR